MLDVKNSLYKNDKARRLLNNITIIVIRWNGTRFTGSKPCFYCCRLMKELGIKQVIYSLQDGSLHMDKVKNLSNDHITIAKLRFAD